MTPLHAGAPPAFAGLPPEPDPHLDVGRMLTVLELAMWVHAVAGQARRPSALPA